MNSAYEAAGYDAANKIGFGNKIGVAIVDFQHAFTDPAFPTGRSVYVQRAVEQTALLLNAARSAGAPVAQSFSAYSSQRDMPRWKVGRNGDAAALFHPLGDGAQLDERTFDPIYDAVFWKRAPSIFFGTSAVQFFVKEAVDTIIIAGCTTSGCVRASAVDAFSYGFRVVIPEACCADQERAAHDANLEDIGRRYADIVTLEECIAHLTSFTPASSKVFDPTVE